MNIELGKIVGVWGVKGWIKLHSYTRNRADISQYKTWYLANPNSLQRSELAGSASNMNADNLTAYTVLSCRQQGPGVIAQLKGVHDRDQAMALNGCRIMVKQTDLPILPEGEYYWQQLIGLTVSNEQMPIGTISSILETGANDVLVCQLAEQGKADVLVPYTKDVVLEVDLMRGTMLVDWDPAYLED